MQLIAADERFDFVVISPVRTDPAMDRQAFVAQLKVHQELTVGLYQRLVEHHHGCAPVDPIVILAPKSFIDLIFLLRHDEGEAPGTVRCAQVTGEGGGFFR